MSKLKKFKWKDISGEQVEPEPVSHEINIVILREQTAARIVEKADEEFEKEIINVQNRIKYSVNEGRYETSINIGHGLVVPVAKLMISKLSLFLRETGLKCSCGEDKYNGGYKLKLDWTIPESKPKPEPKPKAIKKCLEENPEKKGWFGKRR